jgi:urease accessory protein
MTETLPPHSLYRLMTWLSPAFPVGAFSYSHGLEWLIEQGAVRNEADLQGWTHDLLTSGSARNDAIVFVHAYRAAVRQDDAALREIAELAGALSASAERHLEATAQGEAFAETLLATWTAPSLAGLRRTEDLRLAYPVAVAAATADHGIPLGSALLAYLHAFTANVVSAGLRLIPLGQTAGQRIIAALAPVIAQLAGGAEALTLDDLGAALLVGELASMHHETQYTRLFRS